MDRRTVHYPYGEGAPHGDPFQVATNTSSHESRFIGLGLPPGRQTAAPRSTSLDTTPVAFNRYSAYNSSGRAASVNQYSHSVASAISRIQDAAARPTTMLLHDTGELKERVASTEGTLAQSATLDSAPTRGFTAQRGGQITQAKTRAAARSTHQPRDVHDHPPIDPSLSGTTTDDTDREPESLDEDRVELDSVDLTQTERRALQHRATLPKHSVAAATSLVETGQIPSNPANLTTNEVYPTPFLRLTVKDERNKRIFIEVGEQVFRKLQDKSCWPAKLSRLQADPDPAWDVAYLGDLAKQSFRGFKKQWNETQKIETVLRAEANRGAQFLFCGVVPWHIWSKQIKIQTPLHLGLNPTVLTHISEANELHDIFNGKSMQISKILNVFAAASGLDPTFLMDIIHEQYLSDAVSGPEEGSEESRDAWKVRLAAAANKSLDPDSLKNTEIFEVLVPGWRSAVYSTNLIRAMEEFKVDGREDTAPLRQLVYDRVCLDRVSSRIPKYAPYNFGISKQWFDANGKLPAHKTLLKDWNGWPEPADCAPILEQYDIIDDAEVVVES
ncbi:hypothetical protein C8J57DRAFT_1655040 [Mycena rebaudengoi]|nr:hypothetical protein C8J57DRAFT_1655040 [Mycena rebaudengoi]